MGYCTQEQHITSYRMKQRKQLNVHGDIGTCPLRRGGCCWEMGGSVRAKAVSSMRMTVTTGQRTVQISLPTNGFKGGL
jgi:hypothetical protein